MGGASPMSGLPSVKQVGSRVAPCSSVCIAARISSVSAHAQHKDGGGPSRKRVGRCAGGRSTNPPKASRLPAWGPAVRGWMHLVPAGGLDRSLSWLAYDVVARLGGRVTREGRFGYSCFRLEALFFFSRMGAEHKRRDAENTIA